MEALQKRIMLDSIIAGLLMTTGLIMLFIALPHFSFYFKMGLGYLIFLTIKNVIISYSLCFLFLSLKSYDLKWYIKNLLRLDPQTKLNQYLVTLIIQSAFLILYADNPLRVFSASNALTILITVINFRTFEEHDALTRSIIKILFFGIIELFILIKFGDPELIKAFIQTQVEVNLIVFVFGLHIIKKRSFTPG